MRAVRLPRKAADDGEIGPLARAYRTPLITYFQRRRFAPDVAEDLVQEVFARLAKRRLDGIANIEAYLFSTASSVLIDHNRRAKVRHEPDHRQIDNLEIESEVPGPARVFASKQSIQRVAVILDQLPERTREIFVLSRLEGFTNTQLAARYDISVSAIEKHMTRALAHLRKSYRSDG